jgi:hypothetical protein
MGTEGASYDDVGTRSAKGLSRAPGSRWPVLRCQVPAHTQSRDIAMTGSFHPAYLSPTVSMDAGARSESRWPMALSGSRSMRTPVQVNG